jgi:hypothetical protein
LGVEAFPADRRLRAGGGLMALNGDFGVCPRCKHCQELVLGAVGPRALSVGFVYELARVWGVSRVTVYRRAAVARGRLYGKAVVGDG